MGEPQADDTKASSEATDRAREKCDRLGDRLTILINAAERKRQILSMPDASVIAGVERWFSAAEAATFFARTPAWIYDRLAKEKFTYRDGSPIKPVMVGDGPKPRRRFNLDLLNAILLSMHRDGTVKIEELKLIKRRIDQAEFDEVLYDASQEEG